MSSPPPYAPRALLKTTPSEYDAPVDVLPPRRRRRLLSIKIQHLPPDPQEMLNDQDGMTNANALWVNFKGAWVIHVVVIILLKVLYTLVLSSHGPLKNYVLPETNWTLVNITYTVGLYIMFHGVRGTPFEFNLGAYDKLTMWEQLDNGDQYTPARKFLLGVPVALFLVSTHYTNYGVVQSTLNGVCCLVLVVPKLEMSHRLRVTIPFVTENFGEE